jgi:hypothetical protein
MFNAERLGLERERCGGDAIKIKVINKGVVTFKHGGICDVTQQPNIFVTIQDKLTRTFLLISFIVVVASTATFKVALVGTRMAFVSDT